MSWIKAQPESCLVVQTLLVVIYPGQKNFVFLGLFHAVFALHGALRCQDVDGKRRSFDGIKLEMQALDMPLSTQPPA